MRWTGKHWIHFVVAGLTVLSLSQVACGKSRPGVGSGPAASGASSSEPSEAFLRDEAQTAQLAIQALDIYRRDHPDYPLDAEELASAVPEVGGSGGNLAGGWAYSPSGSGYSLRRTLRGGSALVYEFDGSSGTWELQPASGASRRLNF